MGYFIKRAFPWYLVDVAMEHECESSTLFFKFIDLTPRPVIRGMEGAAIIGQQPEITCQFIFPSSETLSITWNLYDKNLTDHVADMTIFETDEFNVTRVVSSRKYNFTRADDGMNLTCATQERPSDDGTADATAISSIELLCEY